MSFFTSVFWKTLWEDKKLMIISIGVVVTLLLAYILWRMIWFHFDRAWNWNLGGYESNTREVVCEMVQREYLTPKWQKECE